MTTDNWTDSILTADHASIINNLCTAFNSFPFMSHNALKIIIADEQEKHLQQYPKNRIQLACVTHMHNNLVGNVRYNMLHGGVTATILDSIGGIQTMAALVLSGLEKGETMAGLMKQISKVATLDLRIDYLKPGLGEHFTATAEIVRLGSKSSTVRMSMVNNENTTIAIATASYVY